MGLKQPHISHRHRVGRSVSQHVSQERSCASPSCLCDRSLGFARALPCAEGKVPPLRQLCSNEAAVITLARAHVHAAACQEDICLCSPFSLASVLPFGALHVPPGRFLVRWLFWNSTRCPPALGCCRFGAGYLIPCRCRSAARCPASHLVSLTSHPDVSLWELQGGSRDRVIGGHRDFPLSSPGSWVQAETCRLSETLNVTTQPE